jgi:hypothetical protein
MADMNTDEAQKRGPGRPAADPNRPMYWDTPLHDLLLIRLDHVDGMCVEGKVKPPVLAKGLKISRWSAYRMLSDSKISPKMAKRIIDLSDGRLTKQELAPFLIL